MKLYFTPTSPFARKTRVVIRERGLLERVTEVEVFPYQNDTQLIAANPLGLVPTLICDDGLALYDNTVICAYLDEIGEAPRLIPKAHEARWRTLTHTALADGVMDFSVAAVMEERRPMNERSISAIARSLDKVRRSLDTLERVTGGTDVHMGSLATAIMLEYLDFRHSDLNWRQDHPALAGWLKDFSVRSSLQETQPSTTVRP